MFLDSFLFIASIILIGGAWLWTYVDVRQQPDSRIHEKSVDQFTIKTAGENKSISVADCYALKAEGNYTSLMQMSGDTVLHQDGIGTILDTLPSYFVRVHKSFAVNLNTVVALKSSTGSKYWVQMSNKEKIPVSRYRVPELRTLLNAKP